MISHKAITIRIFTSDLKSDLPTVDTSYLEKLTKRSFKQKRRIRSRISRFLLVPRDYRPEKKLGQHDLPQLCFMVPASLRHGTLPQSTIITRSSPDHRDTGELKVDRGEGEGRWKKPTSFSCTVVRISGGRLIYPQTKKGELSVEDGRHD
ncbi:hypothetical protein HAX54_019529 [Datura stramonium]|uniref:Ribosomal protein S10 n=1 Tax=Datura stramonium TaxID=4076 RepID=A0ABS8UQ19_DATST|nr:hypothetical protein [Datura stramonium]